MRNKYFHPVTYVLLIVAGLLILAGSLFKVQHWPYGQTMQHAGFVSFFLIGSYEISRLRRVIKMLTSGTSEE